MVVASVDGTRLCAVITLGSRYGRSRVGMTGARNSSCTPMLRSDVIPAAAALGCISPLGRVQPRRSRLFRSFPYNVFPPGTPGDPGVAPKKRRGPRRIFPPCFPGSGHEKSCHYSRGSIGCGQFSAARDRRSECRHRHSRAAVSQSSSSARGGGAGVGLGPACAFAAAILSTNVKKRSSSLM